jgi:hypothetical protein
MRNGGSKKFLPQKSCATGVKKSFYLKNHMKTGGQKSFYLKNRRRRRFLGLWGFGVEIISEGRGDVL